MYLGRKPSKRRRLDKEEGPRSPIVWSKPYGEVKNSLRSRGRRILKKIRTKPAPEILGYKKITLGMIKVDFILKTISIKAVMKRA